MTTIRLPHRQYEAENPDVLAYAEHGEQTRQAAHIARHGDLNGYRSPREFPCPGWLVSDGQIGAIHECVCDVCGFVTTMKERPMAAPTGRTDW